MIYRFRIIFEEFDDVYRDIDIRAHQTVGELINCFLSSISFDNKHLFNFFSSDDYWRRGKELGNSENKEIKKNFSDTPLCDIVQHPHQRFLLLYDQDAQWSFMVELIKISRDESGKLLPFCSKSAGITPKQYKTVIIPSSVVSDDDTDVKPKRGRKSKSAETGLVNQDITEKNKTDKKSNIVAKEEDEEEDSDDDNYYNESENTIDTDDDVSGFTETDEDDDGYGSESSDEDSDENMDENEFGFNDDYNEGSKGSSSYDDY